MFIKHHACSIKQLISKNSDTSFTSSVLFNNKRFYALKGYSDNGHPFLAITRQSYSFAHLISFDSTDKIPGSKEVLGIVTVEHERQRFFFDVQFGHDRLYCQYDRTPSERNEAIITICRKDKKDFDSYGKEWSITLKPHTEELCFSPFIYDAIEHYSIGYWESSDAFFSYINCVNEDVKKQKKAHEQKALRDRKRLSHLISTPLVDHHRFSHLISTSLVDHDGTYNFFAVTMQRFSTISESGQISTVPGAKKVMGYFPTFWHDEWSLDDYFESLDGQRFFFDTEDARITCILNISQDLDLECGVTIDVVPTYKPIRDSIFRKHRWSITVQQNTETRCYSLTSNHGVSYVYSIGYWVYEEDFIRYIRQKSNTLQFD